jgi:septal ring factor EnvC (AmiA/AmiB activator)
LNNSVFSLKEVGAVEETTKEIALNEKQFTLLMDYAERFLKTMNRIEDHLAAMKLQMKELNVYLDELTASLSGLEEYEEE